MKQFFILPLLLLTSTCLLSQSVNWHSVQDLQDQINSIDKPVYVLMLMDSDPFGKRYEQVTLANDTVSGILNKYFYCVKFDPTKETENLTFFNKTYIKNGSLHDLGRLFLNGTQGFPAHLILDQRSEKEKFNAVSFKSGLLNVIQFKDFMMELPFRINLFIPEAASSFLLQTIGVLRSSNFCEVLLKTIQSTPNAFWDIKGERIGDLSSAYKEWETTLNFENAKYKGLVQIHDEDSWDDYTRVVYPFAVAPGNENPLAAFRFCFEMLKRCLKDSEWDVDFENFKAETTVKKSFDWAAGIMLEMVEDEYQNTKTLQLIIRVVYRQI